MRISWIVSLVVLAVAAALFASRPLALLVYAMVAVWVAALVLVRTADRSLLFGQRLSATHIPPGEAVEVEITVFNRGRLPIPWLWLRAPLPVHLEAGGSLQGRAAIAAAGRATFRYAFRPGRRGRYHIGRLEYALGDWFGLRTVSGHADVSLWITVYPTVFPLPPFPVPPLLPVGPRRHAASPFREEFVLGLRDYRPGDPLRWIAWKATARQQTLQVREFPRVRERLLTIVLNLDTAAWQGHAPRRGVERALCVAASYVWAPPDGPHPVGLLSYARSVRYVTEGSERREDPARLVRIPPRTGWRHRREVLEVLATLQPAPGPGLAHLLLADARLALGEALVVLTPGHDPDVWAAASAIAARGHPVTLIGLDPRALPACPGARVLPVTAEGEIRWQ